MEMIKQGFNFKDYTLYWEAKGTFSLILIDIVRTLTRELDFMSFVIGGKEIKHFIGNNVLESVNNRVIALCSDDRKFESYKKEYEGAEKKLLESYDKLDKNKKGKKSLLEFLDTVSKFVEYYLIIDFDFSLEQEEELKKNQGLYNNYKTIGQIKNIKRELLNKYLLYDTSNFHRIMREIGKEFELGEEILFYKKDELIQLYSGIKVRDSEIRERKKYYLIISRKGKVFYLFGDEALKIYNEATSEKQLLEVNLKGQTAYNPKKKVTGIVKLFEMDYDNIMRDVKRLQGEIESTNEKLILVTKATTPEMTHILKKFSGIIADYGAMNAHAAIISREFKIPCIVGTKIASKILKEGDKIEMDLDNGTIRVIEKH